MSSSRQTSNTSLLTAKDAQITHLKRYIANYSLPANLQQRLDEKDDRIYELERDVEELLAQSRIDADVITELRNDVENLENELERNKNEIEELRDDEVVRNQALVDLGREVVRLEEAVAAKEVETEKSMSSRRSGIVGYWVRKLLGALY
ncbi:hypothetical protein K440DRAFT_636734 [Wilcoxina mikolae CBS 423.85]|nr:hypothetical protein K440DRAFT_636734 [Wilcoxina mikolae CBS 423.85]